MSQHVTQWVASITCVCMESTASATHVRVQGTSAAGSQRARHRTAEATSRHSVCLPSTACHARSAASATAAGAARTHAASTSSSWCLLRLAGAGACALSLVSWRSTMVTWWRADTAGAQPSRSGRLPLCHMHCTRSPRPRRLPPSSTSTLTLALTSTAAAPWRALVACVMTRHTAATTPCSQNTRAPPR